MLILANTLAHQDPPKKGVAEAVVDAQKAGVKAPELLLLSLVLAETRGAFAGRIRGFVQKWFTPKSRVVSL